MQAHIATSRLIGERIKATRKDFTTAQECDIFISVLYDTIISEDYIRSKKRCFNFHPGILPEYRGSGAYSWAIINGEKETGVTLHEIDKSVDHGNIIDIVKFPILPTDTAESLFRKAEDVIMAMFTEWYPKLITLDYRSYPQDESKARMYYRMDLDAMRDLTKYVRAFTFKGKPCAYYKDSNNNDHTLEWENL